MKTLKSKALCLVSAVAVSAIGFAQPTDGLIALYTFEGNALDQSGNLNHANPQGMNAFVAGGRSGSALRIFGDGGLYYSNGGYVALPHFDSSLNSGFTFSLWVKDEVIGNYPVGTEEYISFGVHDPQKTGIMLENNSGQATLRYYLNGEPPVHADIPESVGSLGAFAADWKNIVMTYSPGTMTAYLNGEKVGEGSVTANVFPADNAALGRHWWSSGSSARMSVTYDDVAIYDRALSQNEVRSLYTGTSVPDGSNTLGLLALTLASFIVLRRRFTGI